MYFQSCVKKVNYSKIGRCPYFVHVPGSDRCFGCLADVPDIWQISQIYVCMHVKYVADVSDDHEMPAICLADVHQMSQMSDRYLKSGSWWTSSRHLGSRRQLTVIWWNLPDD